MNNGRPIDFTSEALADHELQPQVEAAYGRQRTRGTTRGWGHNVDPIDLRNGLVMAGPNRARRSVQDGEQAAPPTT